ncbi:sporulation protein YqfC [uncultured Clostridium sp.]|uniref:sporulation protein YqfC n=1 Tax=uncultured Clostridium sp. TaxID=59620 RepID=UPI0026021DD4|nr:sporulation protein YqfC [uncultured Clostridium sp.]
MEEKLNEKKKSILKKINIPREVLTGEPKISIIGKEEIKIENHKGIKKFDENAIILNSNIGEINIEGKNFEILYIEEETIIISGIFIGIFYGEMRKNE